MAVLKKDDLGMPIPQVFDSAIGDFQALKGEAGVQHIKVTNLPTDGKYPCMLVDSNGNAIPSINGLYVYLTNEALLTNVFNGQTYVANQNNVTLTLASYEAHTLNQVYNVLNIDSSKMLIKLAGSGVTSIDILITIHDRVIVYDTLPVSFTEDGTCIMQYAKVDKLLPAGFSIRVNAAAGVTYALDIDLVK